MLSAYNTFAGVTQLITPKGHFDHLIHILFTTTTVWVKYKSLYIEGSISGTHNIHIEKTADDLLMAISEQ